MTWLLLVACCVAFVEIFIRIELFRRIRAFRDVVGKAVSTIRSPHISDHWKERVLPRYAWQIFRLSLVLFIFLLVSFSPFVIAALIFNHFGELVMSTYGVVGCTFIALAYVYLRKYLV